MNIFNSNEKLEELVMFGIDWGIFLRHDIVEQVIPFMFLQNGKEQQIRLLMTDGDPMELAKSILKSETKPFQQFIIGFEGYLRDQQNNRTDAIIVHGFDVTQSKGVTLGQMFLPKEKGGFKKIDKVNFLGNPDLVVEQQYLPDANYAAEEYASSVIRVKEANEEITYVMVLTCDSPSLIANDMKRFIRNKLSEEQRLTLSGNFQFKIPPQQVNDEDFLAFLVHNAIGEELINETTLRWQQETSKSVSVTCTYGEKTLYENSNMADTSKDKATDSIQYTKPKDKVNKKWWQFWH